MKMAHTRDIAPYPVCVVLYAIIRAFSLTQWLDYFVHWNGIHSIRISQYVIVF
jgi:hypothetical protein